MHLNAARCMAGRVGTLTQTEEAERGGSEKRAEFPRSQGSADLLLETRCVHGTYTCYNQTTLLQSDNQRVYKTLTLNFRLVLNNASKPNAPSHFATDRFETIHIDVKLDFFCRRQELFLISDSINWNS